MSGKIKAEIKSLPSKKSSGPDGFTAELYKNTYNELSPILFKRFQNTEKEEMVSFYVTNITLIPKPDKNTQTKEKLQHNIPDKQT
jgi:hypothetical protein